MSNAIFDSYTQKKINSTSYIEPIPYSISQIPQNFDYYQGMRYYLRLRFADNTKEESGTYNPYFDLKNEGNIIQNDSPVKSKEDNKTSPKKQKEKGYIDLLINTVNKLFEKGEITKEYLNSRTRPKFDADKFSLTLNNLTENNENTFSEKCDNKMCTYLADSPHKLFKAKFNTFSSYKQKHLWLCGKCYKAYSLENYCYYCHVVYREYEHGTQYYDRKKWIQCDYCSKWHHIQCEEKKGKYENIEDLSMNNNFKYMCPFCRKEHENIIRQKHKKEKMKKIMMNNKNNKNMNNFLNIKRKEKKTPLNVVIIFQEFNKINNRKK